PERPPGAATPSRRFRRARPSPAGATATGKKASLSTRTPSSERVASSCSRDASSIHSSRNGIGSWSYAHERTVSPCMVTQWTVNAGGEPGPGMDRSTTTAFVPVASMVNVEQVVVGERLHRERDAPDSRRLAGHPEEHREMVTRGQAQGCGQDRAVGRGYPDGEERDRLRRGERTGNQVRDPLELVIRRRHRHGRRGRRDHEPVAREQAQDVTTEDLT